MAGIKLIAKIEGEVTIRLTHVEGKFVSKDEVIDTLAEFANDAVALFHAEILEADFQGIGDEGLSVYEIEDSDGEFEAVIR